LWLHIIKIYISCSHGFYASLYHIEKRRLKNSETYYLKKSIRINERVYSIRNNIGKERPAPEEERKIVSTPNLLLEKKALEKRIEHSAGLYKSKYLEPSEIRRLEKSKHWDTFFDLFLTKSELEYFEETNRIEYIQGTTAIEGNTFTIQEVDDLLNRGIVPSSKTLREINEVQNYIAVENYLGEYSGRVTLGLIRKIHELLMDNIDFESAGWFRRIDSIGIRGVDLAVSPAMLIEGELERILDSYYRNIQGGCHPFEEAVLFHYMFEYIHPFTDGNGRVGREILNKMLLDAGFPRLTVSGSERERYIKALQLGNKEQYREMILTFIELLEDRRATVFQEILEGKYS